ncbi:hypothetical protein [Devosia chinhatensis]|uniref:hypothetical protein n=1 Tax=Devosia chinhatensis TaxID=429727 RepID=UPI001AEBDC6C|nr:hypothetical protein [Devosia chinhatensis]
MTFGNALCDALRAAGCAVIGPAPTAFYASQLIGRRHVDAALLDTELYGAPVFSFADNLTLQRTPIIFLSASSASALPLRFQRQPNLCKPIEPANVLRHVEQLFRESPVNEDARQRQADRQPTEATSDPHARMLKTICNVMRANTEATRLVVR